MCRSKPVAITRQKASTLYCAIDDVNLCKLLQQKAKLRTCRSY